MFQVNRKWTYTPTNGRLEALGSDSSSSNSFLVWSIVRNLQTGILEEIASTTTPPLTGNDTHPRWQPEDCDSVRPTLVRLLSKAVGMTGMALTGWTSRWTDGQTKDQLRLKEAESAC